MGSWRGLTGGASVRDSERRTLIACSGGSDSMALVLALGNARPRDVVVGHVRHDLRPSPEVDADRDAVAGLCERLGLSFVERSVRVGGGNAESAAREARYGALLSMASETECRFVATGHHAGDQLESVLMALLRGAGPRGLAGTAARRALGDVDGSTVDLVRPMLELTREDGRRICEAAGVAWREDATNSDPSLLRARLRRLVVPTLLAERPGLGRRLSHHREVMMAAAEALDDAAEAVSVVDGDDGVLLLRDELRGRSEPVVQAALRRACQGLSDRVGRDRLSARALKPVCVAIGDDFGGRRVFVVGCWRIEVDRDAVRVSVAAETGVEQGLEVLA